MDSNSWTSRDPPFPSSATVKYKESMIWKEGSRNISGVQRTISLLIVETTETALDLLQEKDETREAPEKLVSWGCVQIVGQDPILGANNSHYGGTGDGRRERCRSRVATVGRAARKVSKGAKHYN